MAIFTVAIAGGIAAGKTIATEYFRNAGVPVLDADVTARDITTNNKAVINTLVKHFGTAILQKDNALNRAKLRDIIFHDKKAKLWLEQLLHPKIQTEILKQKSLLKSSYCIIALPLIHTSSRAIYSLDMVCSIISNENLRTRRLMQRDQITMSAAKTIIATQISDAELTALSDKVITNNADLESLYKSLEQLHKFILQQV